MIISNEQVRQAVEYLRNSAEYPEPEAITHDPSSEELVSRVVQSLQELPDVRPDRVEHARHLMEDSLPPAEEVAKKVIGRVVSDSLR